MTIEHILSNRTVSMTEKQLRHFTILLISFLTLVDLFATQAIVPRLAMQYAISPAAMGVAVNASTLGMAVSGIAVVLFATRIPKRRGIVVSLALLSVPTALLATMPSLETFFFLRVVQGILMSSAFTLTMAYLAEHVTKDHIATALAMYITGNVASNFVGRLLSSGITDHFGLEANFIVFAALNLLGSAIVYLTFSQMEVAKSGAPMQSGNAIGRTKALLADRRMRHSFAIGFLILFAFVGTFTYVTFVLVRAPIALSQMSVGLAYAVFIPALFTTPFAGRLLTHLSTRRATESAFLIAGFGLLLTLLPSLVPLLIGLSLTAIGLFAAQALVTGFVSRTATLDAASASGAYLASYYFGGLAGSAVLGVAFEAFEWTGCVAGIALTLLISVYFASRLDDEQPQE